MRAALLVACLSFWATAVPAVARTIVVVPGPGTPLQDAIDAAAPGDRLKVQAGTYAEAITIDKPLALVQDVHDLGTSNCWRRNTYTTGSPPSVGCP